MKCNLQPSVLRTDFPLVHRAQLTVRSACLYFAEKAEDVGGVFYMANILRKLKQFTLIFLNCSPDSKHWLLKYFFLNYEDPPFPLNATFFHVFYRELLLMPKQLTTKYMLLREIVCWNIFESQKPKIFHPNDLPCTLSFIHFHAEWNKP